jgi:hypothetical protein
VAHEGKKWAHVVKISRFQSRADYLLFLAGREKRMNNRSYLLCIYTVTNLLLL